MLKLLSKAATTSSLPGYIKLRLPVLKGKKIKNKKKEEEKRGGGGRKRKWKKEREKGKEQY